MARPLHPPIVHFPLACWVLATVLDLAHVLGGVASLGGIGLGAAAGGLLWIGLAAALPAIGAGVADLLRLPSAVRDSAALTRHVLWMSTAAVLYLAAALLRVSAAMPSHAWLVIGLEVLGAAALVTGGHYAAVVVFERLPAAADDGEDAGGRVFHAFPARTAGSEMSGGGSPSLVGPPPSRGISKSE